MDIQDTPSADRNGSVGIDTDDEVINSTFDSRVHLELNDETSKYFTILRVYQYPLLFFIKLNPKIIHQLHFYFSWLLETHTNLKQKGSCEGFLRNQENFVHHLILVTIMQHDCGEFWGVFLA